MLKTVLLWVLLMVFPPTASAALFRPLLFNFTSSDYGDDASLQNWDVTQDTSGAMFFANNSCVLRFDGYSWQRIPMGDVTVRSICADGGRIYVGMHEEFGFLRQDAYGNYTYQTLVSHHKEHSGLTLGKDDEVWNILKIGEMLYFQTFSAIYCYDGHSIRRVPQPFNAVLFIFCCEGKLYAQAMGGGFYRVENLRMERLLERSSVSNDDIMGVLPSPDNPGELLLLTTRHGFFSLDANGKVARKPTAADSELSSGQVNRACATAGGDIVVGTIRRGIICIAPDGRLKWNYETASGLNNNCVLRLHCDRNDNIWACLDNGLALVATGAPYSSLTTKKLATSIGMAYAVNFANNHILVATNQGIYQAEMDAHEPHLQLMPGTEDQNWHLSQFDGTLFAGNNSGTLRYDGSRFRLIRGTESSTSMRRTTWRDEPVIFESSYRMLRTYRWQDGRWQDPQDVAQFVHPLRQIEVDVDGTLWGTDMNHGIYHIRLSNDLQRAEQTDYYEQLDSVNTRCFVTKFEGQVIFSNGQKLYYFDHETEKFTPHQKLNKLLPQPTGVLSLVPTEEGSYWVCTKSGYFLLERQGNQWAVSRRIRTAPLGMRSNDVAATVIEHDNYAYFNLSGGVMRLDLRQKNHHAQTQFLLHRASFTDRRGTRQQLLLSDVREGKAKVDGNIKLEYSYPHFQLNEINFRFTVEGPDDFVVETNEPTLRLPNLDRGRFTVKAEVIDIKGDVIAADEIGFIVPQPWYLRWWALLLYLLMMALVGVALSKYWVRRQTARQRLTMLEQQRIIDQQQKQLLEAQLKMKSKDLAAVSLETAVKNNVINSISESIKEQQKKGVIPKGYMKAELAQIRRSAGDKQSWQLFMQNFDLIHEHFFRNLKERYPSLTTNDLKLCGLLRINLNTKEIADYTSLSVRGVESARLRLRRKLALTPDQNIVEFLVTFK